MKCNEIKNNLGAFLDKQPSTIEQIDFESHIQQCQNCRDDIQQLKIAKQQMATMPAPQLSDSFDSELAARIAQFEQQPPHCQTLNGQVVSNVVPLKAHRQSTDSKSHINQSTNQSASFWAIAATVTFCAIGLTWLMLSVDVTEPNQPQLALEDTSEFIEIETFATSSSELEALPMLTAVDSPDDDIYWSDVEVEQFDQYTQLDDGYGSFNCGSPSGDRGCALAADIMISPLTVTNI